MNSTLTKIRRPVLAAALLLLVPALAGAAVDPHRLADTPTAWYWQYNVSAAQLTDVIDTYGARIIDLEVHSTDPLTFTAALVKNEGHLRQRLVVVLRSDLQPDRRVPGREQRPPHRHRALRRGWAGALGCA